MKKNLYNPAKPYKQDIKKLISRTWETPYVSVSDGVYGIIKKKFSGVEVDHTDGIGTKGVYHWKQRTFKNAVLDALAMNLNDLALIRAKPYKLQNHIILPEDDADAIREIITALTKECKKRKIAVTGGETSIHNTAAGLDISISVSGFIKRPKPNCFRKGDTVIGLGSDGLQANGFTKIRQLFGKKVFPEFTKPTIIYADSVAKVEKDFDIHGMMHITGGAFTKLRDVLPGDADIILGDGIMKNPPDIFSEIYRRGVPDKEMYRIFNCGVGFILSVSPKNASAVVSRMGNASVIGKVVSGNGKIIIYSAFNGRTIKL